MPSLLNEDMPSLFNQEMPSQLSSSHYSSCFIWTLPSTSPWSDLQLSETHCLHCLELCAMTLTKKARMNARRLRKKGHTYAYIAGLYGVFAQLPSTLPYPH